jgi:CRP-like cAMP-binding protein
MPVKPSDLHAIPLFHGITDAHLAELTSAGEEISVPAGTVLFEAGSEPRHLHLLLGGEVALREPGADGAGPEPRFRLRPVSLLGELGAVTGLVRSTTAETTAASDLWRIGVPELRQFFESHGDVAFPFYHNLLAIVTDKVRRDTHRLDETRANLIRTQKGMKRLLELVLQTEETPLSKAVCETLEELIEHNRRSHYLVAPTSTLASWVRLDAGATVEVKEISDTQLRIAVTGGGPSTAGAEWSGVLITPGGEVPVSGKVESSDGGSALIKLDLFIDQYAAVLRDYLTRVQMLDFVV